MIRTRIGNLELVVDEKPNKNGSYTGRVVNRKEGDPANSFALVGFLHDYGTGELFCPRFASCEMDEDVFDEALVPGALEVDKKVQGGEENNASVEISGMQFRGMKSGKNPENTVVFWRVVDPASEFAGAGGAVVVTTSRRGERFVVAKRDMFGGTIRMPVQFSRVKQVKVQDEASSKERTVWAPVSYYPEDYIGFATQLRLTRMLGKWASENLVDETAGGDAA